MSALEMKRVGIISRVTVDILYTGIPRIPALGEELLSEGFTMAPGGGAVVSAVVLQRLGVPVTAGLYLGEGMEKQLALALLERQGLPDYKELPAPGCQPVVFSSVMSHGGDRAIVTYDDPPPPMPEGEMLSFFGGCQIVVLPDAPAPVEQLRAQGHLLVCDPNMPSLGRIAPLLPLLDILTPNRDEAAALTGREDPREALLELVRAGVPSPVVKLGTEGCLGWADGRVIQVPGAEITAAASDTTGAGDNFLAGLLYGLSHGWPVERCLRIANIFGAISTTAVGAFGPPLTRSQVLELEQRQYL